ncbi:MAG: hypothetical protein J0M16_09760, partial [Gammaproteobacteria bacterium]|nr:hypothetical protein [Gammaproteobacteria bacterium]
MSEISLNVAPSPELLKTAGGASPPAAPARIPAGPGETTGTSNPFAALLSGVLQGAQPAAGTPVSPAPAGAFPDLELEPDASPGAANLLALPGTAAPLPAPAGVATLPSSTSPTGNLLPASGNELPLPSGEMPPATAEAGAAPAGRDATSESGTTVPPGRPRIF